MGDRFDAVRHHYGTSREEHRLASGLDQLELVRTQEILRRHLPPPPGRIIDIGGGTGVHAAWLAEDGYEVHVVDIAPRLVRVVEQTLGRLGVTAQLGDARSLAVADAGFDVALVLGPLYHLVEQDERLAALGEARRVVRAGGLVAVAAISRFASVHDGLSSGHLFVPEFRAIARRDLDDGRHVNTEDHPGWFTTAYFHHPDDLRGELVAAGMELVELVGVEGLAGWLPQLEARWADPRDRTTVLEATRWTEAEPSLLGLSAHLLAVASVPG